MIEESFPDLVCLHVLLSFIDRVVARTTVPGGIVRRASAEDSCRYPVAPPERRPE